MKKTAWIIAAAITLAGCKKYLAEEPNKQVSIKTVSQLEALVDNAPLFAYETNQTASFSTDDYEIGKDLYRLNPGAFNFNGLQYYINSVDGVASLASDDLWNGEYKKIFTANLVLDNIDKVTGDDAARARVKADAHFIRAMSYWVLANYYCAPYSEGNLQSMGLPLKKTIEYKESLSRTTLKETYDFILGDITEAEKVAYDDVDPRRAWRVSKKAIAAFRSRYFLFTGDYPKAVEQADLALQSSTARLVDFKTIKPGISRNYSNPAATLRYSELFTWTALNFLYWQEMYYCRYTYNRSWYTPSTSLMNSYDTANDLRYKLLFIPNGGREFSIVTPATTRYTFFNTGYYVPAGFTRAEVLLNKAEALARQGNTGAALEAANILRGSRMSTYVPLTANSKEDAIKQVLAERRRELPFAMRWYDIRRFSVNDYTGDDIKVVREFYNMTATGIDVNTPQTYTLDARRMLVPINTVEINSSNGQILQNPY
ncbi:RagB/SusD family nutrient uptake outer membrane protein [Chitinophaga sp. sic0106]|uniref:RagB/SusD family nutrient uptake outer membrane protein n=1 Tax=Chitinophaga sp. sic0106 TaxID=2854785 RepID=UPI001C4576E2|nr:RagB/SusD family nutrient uptake outer membrane protein [Chitinophaga sp. sic0106]MBV7530247.1 RagB/SusD family nutrient uptake outer membrane protein [Chitinophaga sp. sic0106]